MNTVISSTSTNIAVHGIFDFLIGRIGIHQGDIVLQGTEILGDGVNIASRIEPLAPVGGIALSEKIQQDIASHPEFTTKLLGQPDLKGVAFQLKIYCLTSHGLPEGAVIEVEDHPGATQVEPVQNFSAFWAAAIGALVFVVLSPLQCSGTLPTS